MKVMTGFGQCSNFYLLKTDGVKVNDTLGRNGIKLGLKQALEMHKLKVVQECEW